MVPFAGVAVAATGSVTKSQSGFVASDSMTTGNMASWSVGGSTANHDIYEDSEGLLLLTNDGAWAERVLHPRFGHEREYEVDVEPEPSAEQLGALRRGVPLEEGLGKISGLRVVAPGRLRLVLRTGWKRQVRRMCAAVGLRVTRLRRVRMGPLSVGALPLGIVVSGLLPLASARGEG